MHTGFWWGNLTGRDRLGDPGVHGRIILKMISRKWDGEVWAGLMWLGIGTGSCKSRNELPGFTKCRKFLDWLRTG